MTTPGRSTAARTTAEHLHEGRIRDGGTPYVRYRDGERFEAVALQPADAPLYIGRSPDCAIRVTADDRVSRSHARLVFGAGYWSIEDRGSKNGTYVDGRPVTTERTLTDLALIELGEIALSFHDPYGHAAPPTRAAGSLLGPPLTPTPTQRSILVELARPSFEGTDRHPIPPTNAAIGAAIGFSAKTVRDNVSRLYGKGAITRGGDQRAALVELAVRQRVVTADDYR